MTSPAPLPILCYPDPRLHTVAKAVTEVDARLRTLIERMFATMYEANGIGLAATQVDVHERLVVIDASETRDQRLVLIERQGNVFRESGYEAVRFVPLLGGTE